MDYRDRSSYLAHEDMAARAEDRRAMREFFATPAGRDLTRSVQAATWRPSPPSDFPSYLSGTEAGNPFPPSDSRTFRPAYLARSTSYWPAILAVLVAVISCGALITLAVCHALRDYT